MSNHDNGWPAHELRTYYSLLLTTPCNTDRQVPHRPPVCLHQLSAAVMQVQACHLHGRSLCFSFSLALFSAM